MNANIVYEVFKALSESEQKNFVELLNQKAINKPPKKATKSKLISKEEAIEMLLQTIFSKSNRR